MNFFFSKKNEIYIRRLPYEQAELILKKELDEYYMREIRKIRIVHGKGAGILKKMTWDYLSEQPFVKRFYEAQYFDGGSGATIVEFKD
jgi:DNA mismatch repair protein MutS2